MQVAVKREPQEFKPITVSFLIEDQEELAHLYGDFKVLGDGDNPIPCTWETTDELCRQLAEQLRPFLED